MNLLQRLFASLLVTGALAAAAKAQVVTPNPAPTIIKSPPYTISKPGYYQLGADLTLTSSSSAAIITITASNVTLDFGGHYISGPSSTPATTLIGVQSLNAGNLTIRNGTVAFCSKGIDLDEDGNYRSALNINQRVDNMLISYCYAFGIYLNSAANCEITNNRISFTGGTTNSGSVAGVSVNSIIGAGISILNNTITNTAGGSNVQTYGVLSGDIVSGNTILNVTSPYLALGIESATKVTNNTVTMQSTSQTLATDSIGIFGATFAIGNTVSAAYTGLSSIRVFQNNLISRCHTDATNTGVSGGGNYTVDPQ